MLNCILSGQKKKALIENTPDIGSDIYERERELKTKYAVLENQERQAVRRINLEERAQFCNFASYLRQMIIEQVSPYLCTDEMYSN